MQIDLEKIIELKVSPSEYVILQLLSEKQYDLLERMVINDLFDWSSTITLKGFLEHLQLNGWIKILFKQTDKIDFTKIALRSKAIKLFDFNNDCKFLELWNMYPRKVPNRPPLKAVSSDSDEFKTLKAKWLKIVHKKPLLPDLMIKALKSQLESERHRLQYLQMFSTWINQSTWEKYMDLVDEPVGDSKIERL